MAFRTSFAAHTGVEVLSEEHVCDGSRITLSVETVADGQFLKPCNSCPDMVIQVNRTATTIEFEWKLTGSTFKPFPNSEGIFTVADSVAADITITDPHGTGNG